MEDYKEKYEQALEWARKVIQGKIGFVLDDVLNKFPELKESEDERARKAILELVKQSSHILNPMNQKSMIAWLEKQDPNRLEKEIELAYKTADEVQYRRGYEDAKREFEKQCKQNPAWSEEDERHKNTIICAIHGAGNITPIEGELAEIWLKSLKQRIGE